MSNDALVNVVQQHLRAYRDKGLDLTTPRHAEVMGNPYFASQRSLDLYQGFTAPDVHHSYAHLWLPSENASIADVWSGHSTKRHGDATQSTMSGMRADSYVPSIVTNMTIDDPLLPYDNKHSALHYETRARAAAEIKNNPRTSKDTIEQLRLNDVDEGSLWMGNGIHEIVTEHGARETPHIQSMDDLIKHMHTLPSMGFSRPDYNTGVSNARPMNQEEHALFHAAHRAWPSSTLSDMITHHPEVGFSPVTYGGYLGTVLPHGTIHVRHTVASDNGPGQVHHYAYDPSQETLHHLVTKEDREYS